MEAPPLRAHDLACARRLPSSWHGKLRGGVSCPEKPDSSPWSWLPAAAPVSVGFRPLSTRAVTAARPLLDALGDAAHRP
jgi:hypothetical protein